jgi:hypothetical protein
MCDELRGIVSHEDRAAPRVAPFPYSKRHKIDHQMNLDELMNFLVRELLNGFKLDPVRPPHTLGVISPVLKLLAPQRPQTEHRASRRRRLLQ